MKVDVCIRSFKSGIGYGRPNIDQAEFDEYHRLLIRSVEQIKGHPQVGCVYIVTNGDETSPHCEHPYPDSTTPTSRIITKSYGGSNIIPLVSRKWGMNPGSGAAIMKAIIRAKRTDAHYLLVLSKEIELPAKQLEKAVNEASIHGLQAMGFFRQHWWKKFQWQVPQNTCCLWDMRLFDAFRFNSRCDGDGSTITVHRQEVPVAGMEDFHLLLNVLKKSSDGLRWGMIGTEHPLRWDLAHKTEHERRWHEIKVLRQEGVMRQYIREIFRGENEDAVLDRFFASRRFAS